MDANAKLRIIEQLIYAFPYLLMTAICIISIVFTIVFTWLIVKRNTIKEIKKYLPDISQSIIIERENEIKDLDRDNKYLRKENNRLTRKLNTQNNKISGIIGNLGFKHYEKEEKDGEK